MSICTQAPLEGVYGANPQTPDDLHLRSPDGSGLGTCVQVDLFDIQTNHSKHRNCCVLSKYVDACVGK